MATNRNMRKEVFELLVVVAILAVLAAIAISLFLNQRSKAAQAVVQSDVRNAGANLASASKQYPSLNPASITWNSATQSFTVGSENVPSPVSSGTSLEVAGDTNKWRVVAKNSGEQALYSSEGVEQCNVWVLRTGVPDYRW